MKIQNYAMMAIAAGLLAACGGSSKVVDTTDVASAITSANGAKVYFDFDQSAIRPDARAGLLAQSAYLKANPNTNVQVAGNCDERGTREYNLALGWRRANASKAILVKDGIDPARVSTISFGKEKPYKLGTGEDVWMWNRNTTTTVQ